MTFHVTYRDLHGEIQTKTSTVADDRTVPQSKLRQRAAQNALLPYGIPMRNLMSAVAVDGRPALGRRS